MSSTIFQMCWIHLFLMSKKQTAFLKLWSGLSKQIVSEYIDSSSETFWYLDTHLEGRGLWRQNKVKRNFYHKAIPVDNITTFWKQLYPHLYFISEEGKAKTKHGVIWTYRIWDNKGQQNHRVQDEFLVYKGEEVY